MGEFILARAVTIGDMPAEGPGLSPRQGEVIDTWLRTSRMVGAREDNALPTVTVEGPMTADQEARLVVRVLDADRDSVTGELLADGVAIAKLHDGGQEIVWDTGVLAPGTRALSAVVDDSQGPVTLPLGNFMVTRANGNVAPLVVLQAPFADTIFADRDDAAVRVLVTDPDLGDVVTLDVEAFRDGQTLVIADGVIALPGGNVIDWDTTNVAASPSWRLRVTASDGTATRVVTSGTFIVSHETTTETWSTIGPAVERVCGQCHSNVLSRGPDFGVYEEVYALRGLIYRKAIQRGEMPPPSLEVVVEMPEHMTDEEKARFRTWLLAGAPP
jgi:hypothetical protein